MKLVIKNIVWFFLLIGSIVNAQMNQSQFKREIIGVSDSWHKIILPDAIYQNVTPDLSGIRVFGITKSQDTIEAPYLLQLKKERIVSSNIDFKIINKSYNKDGFYFTIEIRSNKIINLINLDFGQKNFDWKVKLESSHDQKQWFTVLDNYRILSIKNDLTDYKFTNLKFTDSKYQFFRIFISTKNKPNLVQIKILENKILKGNIKTYPIKSVNYFENKKYKQTVINIKLDQPVPVSKIKINVKDTIDFYRKITIKYLADSVKTEQGWKFSYHTLTTGVLNSIEKNNFNCNEKIIKKIKIIIHNNDNEPLEIEKIEIKGYVNELFIRFNKPATYYLTYGNNYATKPKYDLNKFTSNIPKKVKELKLSEEQIIEKVTLESTSPLFKNRIWLWVIMIGIILILGWFSLKMLKT